MKKIAITGGAGFIGTHLARHLGSQGHHVTIIDNFARGVMDRELKELSSTGRVDVVNGDLLKPSSLMELGRGYDQVYHLAAIIGVAHVLKRPYDVLRLNQEMMFNALDFAKHQEKLSRFIFTSTSEVYAGTLKAYGLTIPTPESTPICVNEIEHPRTSYLLSKVYGEALCQHAGLPFTIIRPHNFYGPRMGLSHVIPELLQKAHRMMDGDALEVASVEHRRTFCYITDAVTMMAAAADHPACQGKTFNAGVEQPETTIGELARMVVAATGKRLVLKPIPETSGSPSRRAPLMKNLTQFVVTAPTVDLEAGIRKTYEWYRANLFDGDGVSAK